MRPELDPDHEWVARLSGCPPEAAEAAVAEARDQRDLFDHLVAEHAREGRSSYIEIDAPLELHAIARLLKPRHILEVGVASGVSTAYLLRALELNGQGVLHSIDRPSRPRRDRGRRPSSSPSWSLPPGRAPGWAVPKELKARWDLRVGDKADLVPLVAEELPQVDMFLYDVPHDDAKTLEEFRALRPRLGEGGTAIVDHGPHGDRCAALASWGRAVHTRLWRRRGLGLYGMRRPPRVRELRERDPSTRESPALRSAPR